MRFHKCCRGVGMTVKTKKKDHVILKSLFNSNLNQLKYLRVGGLKVAEEESRNLYLTMEMTMEDPPVLMTKAEMFVRKFELNQTQNRIGSIISRCSRKNASSQDSRE